MSVAAGRQSTHVLQMFVSGRKPTEIALLIGSAVSKLLSGDIID